eukprot:6524705-Pyramimonas_sp.AAC.1
MSSRFARGNLSRSSRPAGLTKSTRDLRVTRSDSAGAPGSRCVDAGALEDSSLSAPRTAAPR